MGSGKDSPGSELIIAAVDKNEPRPLWVACWGGCNTLAQAIWKVRNTRSAAELTRFLAKLRVFDVLGQDDTGAWLTKTFPDLFFIRATGVYGWAPTDSWIDTNVQNHGPLGAVYPDKAYATEGDSPAFMHLHPSGLNDPEKVALNAAGSSDPDGNTLAFSWSFHDEASSHNGGVTIQGASTSSARVSVPTSATGKSIHVILELRDNGTPNLHRYRRVIINVQ